jgi:hypothetical protein
MYVTTDAEALLRCVASILRIQLRNWDIPAKMKAKHNLLLGEVLFSRLSACRF